MLVVDDDTATLSLLQKYFASKGWEVVAAPSALDALSMLSYDLDLIITDYDMPGLSGFDFRLMVSRRFPLIPVIGITGETTEEKSKYMPIFQGVLKKPFRMGALWNLVNQVLAGKTDGDGDGSS